MYLDPQYAWIVNLATFLGFGVLAVFCVHAFRRRFHPIHPLAPSSLIVAGLGVLVLVLGTSAAGIRPDPATLQKPVNLAGACVLLAGMGIAGYALVRFRHSSARPLDFAWPGREYAWAAIVIALAALCAEILFVPSGTMAAVAPSAGDVAAPDVDVGINPKKFAVEVLACGAVIAYSIWLMRRRINPIHPLSPAAMIATCVAVLCNAIAPLIAQQHPDSEALARAISITIYLVFLAAGMTGAYALWHFRQMRSRPLDGPWPGKRYAMLALVTSLGLDAYMFVMANGGQEFLNRLPVPYADSRAGVSAMTDTDEKVIWFVHLATLLVCGVVIIFAAAACRRRINPVRPPGPVALILVCLSIVVFVVGLDLINGFNAFRKGRILVGGVAGCLCLASIALSVYALWRYRHERPRPIDGPWPGKSYAGTAACISILMILTMAYYGVTHAKGLPLDPGRWKMVRGMRMFPEAGCAFKLPLGWSVQEGSHFQPTPLIMATRTNPNLSLALVATAPSAGATENIRTLVQLTIDDMIKTGAEVSRPLFEADQMKDGEGGWLTLSVKRGKGKFVYAIWLCIHNGSNYRFYIWGPVENLAVIRDSGEILQNSSFFWFKDEKK